MGYTVRTDDGYRLTRYVKYSTTGCHTRASSPRGRRRQRMATNPRYVAQCHCSGWKEGVTDANKLNKALTT